ncbi:MAG TPA: MFS transporter, partial [Thermomicrobiales bacterium]|nr:MFS transporter [Thermomicrobiales bacterium]
LGTRAPARAPAPAGARPGLLTGLRPALASRPLLLVIALIFLVQFATQMIGPVLPIFVQQLVGPGGRVATLTGLALAAGGVAAALSAVALGRVADRLGHHRILAWATLGGALATAPQALVGAFAPFLALRAAAGLFAGGLTTSTSAAIGLLTTPGRRGAAFGVAGSAFSLGNALGPLLGGLLTAAAGPRAPFAAAAVALALGWLVVRALAGARAPEGRPAVGAGGHP